MKENIREYWTSMDSVTLKEQAFKFPAQAIVYAGATMPEELLKKIVPMAVQYALVVVPDRIDKQQLNELLLEFPYIPWHFDSLYPDRGPEQGWELF